MARGWRISAAGKLLLAARDVAPGRALARLAEQGVPLDHVAPAPAALGAWGDSRQALRAALAPMNLPGDAVLLIGEGALQRDWAEAGALAGFLPGDRFFAPADATANAGAGAAGDAAR